ncbi:MAG: hypothetical protein ACQEXX_12675 [Bacillota bacterium]
MKHVHGTILNFWYRRSRFVYEADLLICNDNKAFGIQIKNQGERSMLGNGD